VDETTGFSANLLSMKATPLEPEIITRKGKPVSVILPIKKYAELLERVEDAEDIAWLRKARQKPLSYRPLEEYVSEREKKRRV
jgi:antitoxin (DNA-binding transcriptional repressor) of toxin-antitoxin stability system